MMNHSSTNNKLSRSLPVKNIFSTTPQKVSPFSASLPKAAMSIPESTKMNRTAAEKKAVTPPQKPAPLHTPIHRSMQNPAVEEMSVPARPQKKPAHPHWKSTSTKGRASVESKRPSLMQNEDRMSARRLRKIKRRLFLEAVNSEPHNRVKSRTVKSPWNVVRQDLPGKKNRTGKE
mmetsp:Transcript_16850/g.29009  ORF Transcript_16850/g.29009 Transcript_16850/m.29009 type:complete len:175 (-) Transcript_16850:299-823(-)